jgi:hypothetical protein
MKYLVLLFSLLILILILILTYYKYTYEGFTTYQLNYRTDIEPNRAGTIPQYRRCICSSDGECRCVTDVN